VEVDTGSGFNLNSMGIILMVGGLLGLLVSVLFWSSPSSGVGADFVSARPDSRCP
jgi:hypothetical protein